MPSELRLKRSVGLDRNVGLRTHDPADLRNLWESQCRGVRFLRAANERLLALGPGCGKTAIALRALFSRDRAIAVAPAALLNQWGDAIEQWRPDMRIAEGRLRRPNESEVLLTSWDRLRSESASGRMIYEPLSDVCLIADEVDRAKNEGAQRSRGWRLLTTQCRRIWALSGTPMAGKRSDLWGVLQSTRLDKVLGITKKRFEELEPAEVKTLLSGVMLRWSQADVFDNVPKVERGTITVEAPDDLKRFLEVPSKAWDKLRKGELPPFELVSQALAALASSRTDPARAFSASHATERDPMLVFSAHTAPVRAVGQLPGFAYFDGETPRNERDTIVKAFQGGKLRGLALTLDVGGIGLNLHAAGAMLFIDQAYTPAKMRQAEDRAARPGQKRPLVRAWYMTSDHPLDIRIREILERKEQEIAATIG